MEAIVICSLGLLQSNDLDDFEPDEGEKHFYDNIEQFCL